MNEGVNELLRSLLCVPQVQRMQPAAGGMAVVTATCQQEQPLQLQQI